MTASPWVIAHRGASRDRPENSLAAFDEAIRQGCDGIELDLRLRRDEVVIQHDPPPFAPGIPTLDEVLARYARRTRLFLEIKSGPRNAELVDRSVALVRKHRAEKSVRFLCFNASVLKTLAPGIPRVLNVERPRRIPPGLAAVCADVRRLAPGISAGLPLYVYTCNIAAAVDRAIRFGAAAVLSDRPGWLRKRLGR